MTDRRLAITVMPGVSLEPVRLKKRVDRENMPSGGRSRRSLLGQAPYGRTKRSARFSGDVLPDFLLQHPRNQQKDEQKPDHANTERAPLELHRLADVIEEIRD